MSERPSVSDRLRSLRLAAGLTLESLSERSGVSVRGISDIERGVSVSPRRATLEALADGLALDTWARRSLLDPDFPPHDDSVDIAPPRIADFVGRDDELAMLRQAMTRSGGVAIISGAPGLGKTTLALESVRLHFSDSRTLFTDLAGDRSRPATHVEALRRLLRQLDPHVQLPSTLDAAIRAWRAIAAGVRPVVVFDNAGQESQVRPLIVDGLRFSLVTSRRKLAGLSSTARVLLQPLAEHDSLRFLGRAIPPSQGGASALSDLARLCGGYPLALRIAGNHVASRPGTSASEYAARLSSRRRRIRLLAAGDLSVEAAFTLTYDGLDRAVAELFRAVAMIEGRTFEARLAAAAVASDDQDAVEGLLDELVESGLLETAPGGRYRMHDLTRVFGRLRLTEEEGEERIGTRVRRWLLDELGRAVSAPSEPLTDEGATGAEWMRGESEHWWPAMQGVARAGDHATVLKLSLALQEDLTGLWLGWGNWASLFELGVRSARAAGDDDLIAALLGTMHWASVVEQGDDFDGVSMTQEIIERAQRADNGVQLGWGYYHLAWALLRRGDTTAAHSALARGQDAFVRFADPSFRRETFLMGAAIAVEAGNAEAAEELLREARRQFEEELPSGRQRNGRMASLELLTRIASRRGNHALAVAAGDAQVELADMTPSDYLYARAFANRATALLAAGDVTAARADLERARSLVAAARRGALVLSLQRTIEDLARTIDEAGTPLS